jgi:adenylate cyclase
VEVVAIVVSVSGETVIGAQAVLSMKNLIATVAVVIIGTISVSVSGVALVALALHRSDPGRERAAPQRRKAPNITRRQSAILLTPWAIAAFVLLPLNLHDGVRVAALLISAVLFGATATVCTGFLFTQRPLRSLMIAVTTDLEHAERAPGVRARLILMWTLCTALPGAGIVVLVLMRANSWIIQDHAPIEVPVMVLALVAVVLGLRAMILVSTSISDPVHEVVDAMAEVERGRIDHMIDVYERSELGQLQSGFNRMVTGLQERDRLRDLFGRHVGTEVVRRAIGEIESLSGDEREAAILFIDLVGSTQLAATREPHEVAKVLNDFFRIVVAQVDRRDGLVNKFQGDAVLAVFGAPLRIAIPPRRHWPPRGRSATNYDAYQSTSGSGCPRGPSSQATSERKTVTSTRLLVTLSTKRRGWPTAPRTQTVGCCVQGPRSTAPTRRNASVGLHRARRSCAADQLPRRSRRQCPR